MKERRIVELKAEDVTEEEVSALEDFAEALGDGELSKALKFMAESVVEGVGVTLIFEVPEPEPEFTVCHITGTSDSMVSPHDTLEGAVRAKNGYNEFLSMLGIHDRVYVVRDKEGKVIE